MGLLENIKEIKLTNVEKQIGDFILKSPQLVLELSTREFAQMVYTSPTAIVRFCHKLGSQGFPQFKIQLASELSTITSEMEFLDNNPIKQNDSIYKIIHTVEKLEYLAISDTANALDYKVVEKVIPLLDKAEQIDFYGSGVNLHIAQELTYLLMRVGKKAYVSDSTNVRLTQAFSSKENHIAIILSHTGETQKYIDIVNILNEKKTMTISLTGYIDSTIAKLTNYHFYVRPGRRFKDMGPVVFSTSTRYVLYVLFASLFAHNYSDSVKKSDEYAKLANYELQIKDENEREE